MNGQWHQIRMCLGFWSLSPHPRRLQGYRKDEGGAWAFRPWRSVKRGGLPTDPSLRLLPPAVPKKTLKRYFSVHAGGDNLGFMATEKAETDRVPVTLALSTISYLEKLVRQGTHGTSVPGVAKTLIEEGIRLAIKDGLLAVRDNSKGSHQERP